MSQNKTLTFSAALLAAFVILSPVFAPAAHAGASQPMRDCVNGILQSKGIDLRMQNRFNINTFAGQIQADAVRECDEKLGFKPASYQNQQPPADDSAAEGVREI
jgi:hypothetical protein